jgi:hypothetical protein
MTRNDALALGLQAQIALERLGGMALLALMLPALGAGAWLVLASQPPAAADALRQTLAARQARLEAPAAAAPATPAAQHPMEAFYAVLGEPAATERYLGLLFDAARRSGIGLAQGEYQGSIDSRGQTERYQIRLPIKGSYAAIRGFCETVLRELPFASLDELALKRETVADDTLTATVQFSLHLQPGAATAAAAAGTRP